MNPEPHPDEITDWKALKEIRRGARQAIDDEAIEAYLRVYRETKDEQKAGEANRLVYQKYYGNGNQTS